ncbi:MAG TPA: group 1 truncated hemoglobin [Labilithrix sp.]
MRKPSFVGLVVVLGLAGFVACGPKKQPPKEPAVTETVTDAGADDADAEPPKPKALIDRLGGKDGIAKVVDTFVKNVAADNKINKRFAKLKGDKMDKFKSNLIAFICDAASPDGQPQCNYAGKNMKDAHHGMKIKEDEWSAIVADLKSALDENKVPQADQDDLIALIGPLHDDIVEVKPKEKKK